MGIASNFAELANSFSTGQIAFRNRLINGDMRFVQRYGTASSTITAGAANAGYVFDRWWVECLGANTSVIQSTGTGSFQYVQQFTGAASVTNIYCGQRIESANIYDLASTTVTLSAYLANSLLTTVTWTAYYPNTTDSYGTFASPTKTQIATGTFTVNSTLTRYSTTISLPSNVQNGLEIVFSVGAQTSGTFTMTGVQVEAGSLATPFEFYPYEMAYVRCQRYCPCIIDGGNGGSVFGTGAGTSTTAANMYVPFVVPARTAPTSIVVTSTFVVIATGITTTSIVASTFGINGSLIVANVASGLTVNAPYWIRTATGTSKIWWNGCEL